MGRHGFQQRGYLNPLLFRKKKQPYKEPPSLLTLRELMNTGERPSWDEFKEKLKKQKENSTFDSYEQLMAASNIQHRQRLDEEREKKLAKRAKKEEKKEKKKKKKEEKKKEKEKEMKDKEKKEPDENADSDKEKAEDEEGPVRLSSFFKQTLDDEEEDEEEKEENQDSKLSRWDQRPNFIDPSVLLPPLPSSSQDSSSTVTTTTTTPTAGVPYGVPMVVPQMAPGLSVGLPGGLPVGLPIVPALGLPLGSSMNPPTVSSFLPILNNFLRTQPK